MFSPVLFLYILRFLKLFKAQNRFLPCKFHWIWDFDHFFFFFFFFFDLCLRSLYQHFCFCLFFCKILSCFWSVSYLPSSFLLLSLLFLLASFLHHHDNNILLLLLLLFLILVVFCLVPSVESSAPCSYDSSSSPPNGLVR